MFTVLSNLAREMFRRQGLPEEDVVYAVTDELASGEYKQKGLEELRGSTAYPGLARGKVSVISSKKDGDLIEVDADRGKVKKLR